MFREQRRVGRTISSPSQQRDGISIGDLQQQRPYAFVVAELIDPSECLQEGRLNDILGIGAIPQQSLGHIEDSVDVRVAEILEP